MGPGGKRNIVRRYGSWQCIEWWRGTRIWTLSNGEIWGSVWRALCVGWLQRVRVPSRKLIMITVEKPQIHIYCGGGKTYGSQMYDWEIRDPILGRWNPLLPRFAMETRYVSIRYLKRREILGSWERHQDSDWGLAEASQQDICWWRFKPLQRTLRWDPSFKSKEKL